MKLRDLDIGQQARITGYTTGDRAYRHKLLRMGLVKGTTFTLLRRAPLGDPIEIDLKGFKLTLRKAEADAVEIEGVSAL